MEEGGSYIQGRSFEFLEVSALRGLGMYVVYGFSRKIRRCYLVQVGGWVSYYFDFSEVVIYFYVIGVGLGFVLGILLFFFCVVGLGLWKKMGFFFWKEYFLVKGYFFQFFGYIGVFFLVFFVFWVDQVFLFMFFFGIQIFSFFFLF